MPREKMRDVIVLLPGLTGTVLQKDGKDVWNASISAILGSLVSGGGHFRELILRDDSPDREDLGDGVVAARVMPDVHFIPGLWKIDGYSKIGSTIKDRFEVTDGQNFFEFPYDWRRDNRASAKRLARQSHDWLKRWRDSSGNADAKLILVGHSMGGIVSRCFLELLDGWRDTRALLTFGTPYRGAPGALDSLANGVRKGPFGMLELTELTRSCTSVYQLLPMYPSYDGGDGRLVRLGETTGVPNVDAARAAAALAMHKDIQKAVETHLATDAYRRDQYRIFPLVGIAQATAQSARRKGNGVEILEAYDGQDLSGDGTVPRVSATPLELSDQGREMYSGTKHGSLQNADACLTHLVGALTSLALKTTTFRGELGAVPVRLGLKVEDLYFRDEPITVTVRPEEDVPLEARVTDTTTGREAARGTLAAGDDDGPRTTEFAPLPPGAYRIRVTGPAGVEPVEDVFAVLDKTGR
jgi:pimeloyl-ACP methyl ester carboxylesterase